jgi:hypothetical protein
MSLTNNLCFLSYESIQDRGVLRNHIVCYLPHSNGFYAADITVTLRTAERTISAVRGKVPVPRGNTGGIQG